MVGSEATPALGTHMVYTIGMDMVYSFLGVFVVEKGDAMENCWISGQEDAVCDRGHAGPANDGGIVSRIRDQWADGIQVGGAFSGRGAARVARPQTPSSTFAAAFKSALAGKDPR